MNTKSEILKENIFCLYNLRTTYRGHMIDVRFDENREGILYLLGENGSGKSTVIEAILSIFSYLNYVICKPSLKGYDFTMRYRYGDYIVSICNEKGICEVDYQNIGTMEKESITELFGWIVDNILRSRDLIPKRFVSIYSGENNRLKNIHTNAIQDKFIYIEGNLIPILIACTFMYENFRKKIADLCGINIVEEITFSRSRYQKNAENLKIESELLYELLSKRLGSECIATDESDNNKKKVNRKIVLHLSDIKCDGWELFKVLKEANEKFPNYVCDSKIRNRKGAVLSDRDLSQGERQWIKVIGMLFIAKSCGAVSLLDEPEAYMNPRWKYQFNQIICELLDRSISSDIIISTHDPMMVNGVNSENIIVIERNEDKIASKEIDDDMIGMGIDGILTSACFGLKTTYDIKTVEKYQRRNKLFSKAFDGTITEEENEELYHISKNFSSRPIGYSSLDFVYMDFYREYIKSEYYDKEVFSVEELINKRKAIRRIIDKVCGGNE